MILVSGKSPSYREFFWKELIGALIGDLDALIVHCTNEMELVKNVK
jgi:hypothetical protein